MTATEWGILIGAFVALLVVHVPWLLMVNSKLAVLTSKLDTVCKDMESDRDERRRIWEHLDRHAERITRTEEQVKTLVADSS